MATPPRSSVTVAVTVYVPGWAYVWAVVVPVPGQGDVDIRVLQTLQPDGRLTDLRIESDNPVLQQVFGSLNLETLRQQGFVEWEEQSGVYSVGLRAYQVGLAFTERSNLIQSAQPEMEALVRDLNETVNLAVLYGEAAVALVRDHGTVVGLALAGAALVIGVTYYLIQRRRAAQQ